MAGIDPGGQDGLNALGASETVLGLREVVRQLELMRRGQAANNKEIEVYGNDLHSIMRDTANLELSLKRIGQLQRTTLHPGTSKPQAVTALQAMTKEYETLLQTMNKTHGGELYTKKITANLTEMRRALKAVERQSEDTWDTKGLRECNAELETMHESVRSLASGMKAFKTSSAREEFRALGSAIDDAFHNRLSLGLRKIPGVGHAMQAMDVNRRFRGAGAEVTKFKGNRELQRREMADAITRERAIQVKARFGSAGLRTLNTMGHPTGDPSPASARGLRDPGTSQMNAAARASGGGTMDQMEVGTLHVDTLVMSGKLKLLNPNAPAPPKTALDPGSPTTPLLRGVGLGPLGRLEATPEAVAAHLANLGGGPGGKLSSAMDMAKAMQGGGMVDLAADVAGKLLKGGPLVAGILGAVKLAVSLYDQAAVSNQKVADGLAGQGLFGGGKTAYQSLHQARTSLISTSLGQQMLYGQGFDKNLELYKTLGDQGIASGKTLTGGLDLNQALAGGGGFHGAVMQNAVQFGPLSGFGQAESVKLTLKLIEKFGATTDATKQFFVELNEFSNTSGISASRIVDMVDGITDQFSDLQKSLIGTVEALHKVGDAGMFMGKRVEDTVKGLSKPLELSPAQRYYNVSQQMTHGGGEAMAEALRRQNAAERGGMLGPGGALAKYGLTGASRHEDILAALMNPNIKVDGETRRADMEAYQQQSGRWAVNEDTASAWAKHDVKGVLAAQMNGGETLSERLGGRIQLMRSTAQTAGISEQALNAALSGDPEAQSKILHNAVFALATSQGTFGAGENPAKMFQETGNARQAGAATIMQVAAEGASAGTTPGQQQARQRLLERYGRAVAGPGTFQAKDGNYGQAFTDYMRSIKNDTKAQGRVVKALTQTASITGDVLNPMTDLSAAIKSQTEDQKEKEAKETREALAINTTTSDMAMARAFEYLFNQVTNHIDLMADLMDDKTGIRSARDAFKTSLGGAVNQVAQAFEGKTPTRDQQKMIDELKDLSKHATEGSKGEMQARSDRAGQLKDALLQPEWYQVNLDSKGGIGSITLNDAGRKAKAKIQAAADKLQAEQDAHLKEQQADQAAAQQVQAAADRGAPDPQRPGPTTSLAEQQAAHSGSRSPQPAPKGDVHYTVLNTNVNVAPYAPTAAHGGTQEAQLVRQLATVDRSHSYSRSR